MGGRGEATDVDGMSWKERRIRDGCWKLAREERALKPGSHAMVFAAGQFPEITSGPAVIRSTSTANPSGASTEGGARSGLARASHAASSPSE